MTSITKGKGRKGGKRQKVAVLSGDPKDFYNPWEDENAKKVVPKKEPEPKVEIIKGDNIEFEYKPTDNIFSLSGAGNPGEEEKKPEQEDDSNLPWLKDSHVPGFDQP